MQCEKKLPPLCNAALALAAGLIFFPTLLTAGPLDKARKAELTNLVRQDCGSCHGMTLKGGLGKPLLPHNLKDKTVGDIAQVILDGVPGKPMPPWRGLLGEPEAFWIAARLKSGQIKRGNRP